MKKKLALLLLCTSYLSIKAQQWIDKKYDYDSVLNITYGTSVNFNGGIDSLTMDIYTPICDDINHTSRKPLLMWIHGGAFLAGNKNEMTNLCKQFAKRGYVTATINYRKGFISDDNAWNCNYPNYSCVFATDSAEWYRSYFRAVQDAKGALRYLINRNTQLKIDTNNIFVAGESAGAFLALAVALLDTAIEKPAQAYAISNAPNPINSALSCQYNLGKVFSGINVARPDLGDLDGTIEPTSIAYKIKGIGNMYGAMTSDLLKNHKAGNIKPSIFSFHQPCDLVVPIDSGAVYTGLSWCMTNGYNCYAIANTPKVYGSRAFSIWNTINGYGYTIHDEFTATNFPYNFLVGAGSCADQINIPCHAYDNSIVRENNLAAFFAPLVTTSPVCDTALFTTGVISITDEGLFNLYPNPSANILNIFCSNYTNFTITIYDMLGQKQSDEISLTQDYTTLSVKNLHSGLYVLIVKDKNKKINSIQFVKE
jgi:hypothetical protein